MKLWQKNYKINSKIEKFTVSKDYLLDYNLVKYDCNASIAHAKMLCEIDVLNKDELNKLIKGLNKIIKSHEKGKFVIYQQDEDCHTAIENYLTKHYGEVGKKIHTARSRNDQVLTALRLYEKKELSGIVELLKKIVTTINDVSKKNSGANLPGYTHMQKAMPTTINSWLGCFSASFNEDITQLNNLIDLINSSPLGSAAGFGVPVLKIDKKLTSELMGFKDYIKNPIYAQMTRSKYEPSILHVLSQIMFSLNKLSSDLIMFSMKEFRYISLPEEFCTGSSIMPQKKNPDVLELIRAKYHVVLAEEFKVKSIVSNLISGYNRDMQLTKGPVINSIEIVKECLEIMNLLLNKIKVNENKCQLAITPEMYATQEVYMKVKKNVPFREAYQQKAKELS